MVFDFGDEHSRVYGGRSNDDNDGDDRSCDGGNGGCAGGRDEHGVGSIGLGGKK